MISCFSESMPSGFIADIFPSPKDRVEAPFINAYNIGKIQHS